MLAPERIKIEVELFWIMPVTLVSMTALMAVVPEPVPELVIVPVLLTLVVERVIPEAIALLLLSTRLPVPVTPPDTVSTALPLELLFVRVVPPLFTVRAVVLIVRAEVVLFSMICVTFAPTPPLIVTLPLFVPELVIVPVLLTDAVERVMPEAIALLFLRIKLPVPVTPPDTVSRELPLALLFVRVVPVTPFTVMAPLTVRAEVG